MVIIEARVNPGLRRPARDIARDAAECEQAGAAVLHFRAPDGITCGETVAAIRASSGVLVHATCDTAGDPMPRLLRTGLAPDFAPLDVTAAIARRVDPAAWWAAGTVPHVAIWSLASLRLALGWMARDAQSLPVFASLAFTAQCRLAGVDDDSGMDSGPQAYLRHLPAGRSLPWAALLAGGEVLPHVAEVVAAGGHLCVGVHRHPEASAWACDAERVARVADAVRRCGHRVATPQEARTLFQTQTLQPLLSPELQT